jgi:hypothetical protein
MKALKKKIESGTKEQEKARAKELERLLQRYQNIKKELDSQHHLERNKFEKSNQVKKSNKSAFLGKSGTFHNMSKMSSPSKRSINETPRVSTAKGGSRRR